MTLTEGLLLLVNVLLLIALGYLWLELRCTRDAIGRLYDSPGWWTKRWR